jgi:membrane protein implicated in regulation of membrane protease activity
MLPIFVSMFVFGGASLLALLWLGAADAGLPEATTDQGVVSNADALLTVRGALSAMTLAGAVGTLLLGVFRLPLAVSMVGAGAGAYVGAAMWRRVLRAMRAFDRDHGVSTEVLLGREGTLTVGIGGPEAPGVVQVTLGGLSQEYMALPEDARSYAEGSRVVVVRILSESSVAVESSPYPVLSSSP